MGAGGRGSRMESWLQGAAITHQRPGQPASLCALCGPPVPGHRPPALEQGSEGGRAGDRVWAESGCRTLRGGVTRAGFLEEGDVERSWTEGRLEEENGFGLRGGKMEWVLGDQGVSGCEWGGRGEGGRGGDRT